MTISLLHEEDGLIIVKEYLAILGWIYRRPVCENLNCRRAIREGMPVHATPFLSIAPSVHFHSATAAVNAIVTAAQRPDPQLVLSQAHYVGASEKAPPPGLVAAVQRAQMLLAMPTWIP
jgi:hypothetical protein